MGAPDEELAGLLLALQRVREAEAEVVTRRREFRDQLLAVNAAGVSKSAIARALGVSRQRVQTMFEEAR